MPKIEGDRYPAKLTAEEAAEIAKVLANDFNGQASSEEAFAQALGHSTSNSGSFIKKVADARNYGVLPTRGLEITPLGQRVANPRDKKERTEALFEMYENVPILDKLYEQLDGREPPNKLWSILIEISDAERNEAKEAEDDILRLYEAMLSHDEPGSKDSTPNQPDQHQEFDETPSSNQGVSSKTTPESAIYLKVGDDVHKFGELSAINIEIAQKILESKKTEVSGPKGDSSDGAESTQRSAGLDDFS